MKNIREILIERLEDIIKENSVKKDSIDDLRALYEQAKEKYEKALVIELAGLKEE